MQPLAGVTNQRDESLFEIEMDVLQIARPRELATLDFATDLLQSTLDGCYVGGRQHPRRTQHPGVRERGRNVGIRQPLIEIYRCGVQLDELGDRLAEAAGPAARLVVGVVRAHSNTFALALRLIR